MNKSFCTLFAVLFTVFAVAGAEESEFRFYRELTPPADVQTKQFNSVRLPGEVFAKMDSLDDLRLFSASGVELPFLREQVFVLRTERRYYAEPSRVKSFSLKDNRAVIIVEPIPPQKELRLDRVTILTGEKDFEKKLSAFGADAAGKEAELLADEPFFDQTSRLAVSRKTFPLSKPAVCRELRIVIDNYGEEHVSPLRHVSTDRNPGNRHENYSQLRRELKIDGVNLEQSREVRETAHPAQIASPVEILGVVNDAASKTTVITFDGRRQPVTRLALRTSDVNWSREVLLQDPESGYVRRARLQHLDLPGILDPRTAIEFDGLRRLGPSCKLTIFNEDNPPLSQPRPEGLGPEFRLVLLPGTLPARLGYGSAGLPPGRYDAGELLAKVDPARRQYNEFRIGGEQLTPNYKAAVPEKKFLRWNQVFFIVLGVLILVLVIFIIFSMKKIEKDSSEV